MDVLGRVGPLQGGGIVEVAAGRHSEVGGCHGHVVIHVGRHEVDDGSRPIGVVDFVDNKIAVVGSAPTPVVVEEVVVVVAVAHESMSATFAIARIIDGPSDVELPLEQVLPVGKGIVVSASDFGFIRIGEIVFNGIGHVFGVGTAAVVGETHVDRHATVVHQRGDGLYLLLRRVAGDSFRHVVPVVIGGAEVGTEVGVVWPPPAACVIRM